MFAIGGQPRAIIYLARPVVESIVELPRRPLPCYALPARPPVGDGDGRRGFRQGSPTLASEGGAETRSGSGDWPHVWKRGRSRLMAAVHGSDSVLVPELAGLPPCRAHLVISHAWALRISWLGCPRYHDE